MTLRTKSLLAIFLTSTTVATLTGCFGSVAAPANGNEPNASTSSAQQKVPERKTFAAHSSTPSSASSPEVHCVYDAGCDGTVHPISTSFTIDGKACKTDGSNGGLDMGLDGNGWQVNVTSDECGVSLDVSGLDDAAYPQTDLVAFLGESRIELFTNESLDDVDGGIGGMYQTNPGGNVVVESGPVHGVPVSIKGHAHVIGADGHSTHDLVFSMVF